MRANNINGKHFRFCLADCQNISWGVDLMDDSGFSHLIYVIVARGEQSSSFKVNLLIDSSTVVKLIHCCQIFNLSIIIGQRLQPDNMQIKDSSNKRNFSLKLSRYKFYFNEKQLCLTSFLFSTRQFSTGYFEVHKIMHRKISKSPVENLENF